MATTTSPLSRFLLQLQEHRGLAFPILAMALVLVILIPLPTSLMDFLLIANITLSALVLLTVMYVNGPLEFSAFPSLLLALTLFRLVLNTATVRLILTNADGTTAAAGHVIEEFSRFVAAGSLPVGIIIFIIITVIQFVVITKGATRIAEVAARFTLDAMPGKQMAIDADLSAGLINEEEARRRRENITREADFYGAMDGASKFVRGDAIAGVIITIVNILGGIYVGMVEKNLPIMKCLEVFTKLTIGDGLTAQIPAFLVSIGAGMIVTRSTAKTNMGEELIGQITSRPHAMMLAAGFLGILMLTPLPKIPLLAMAIGMGGSGYLLVGRAKKQDVAAGKARLTKSKEPDKVETFLNVDALELEIGYGLVKLVDKKQGGDLLDRITNIRRQIATELGLIVPPIRIRDNVQLQPNQYTLRLRGALLAKADLMPGHLLAIDPGTVSEPLHGIETLEPAFGLRAIWIPLADRSMAEQRNYTVVEPTSVLATHLTELIRKHASEILTRQDVHKLLDHLKERSPKVIEELIPEPLKVSEVQAVLQHLLRERVSVRDLETILETLGDWGRRTKDPEVLSEYVRSALARAICDQHRDENNMIHAVTLDPTVEDTVAAHLERTDRGSFLTMPPVVASKLVATIRQEVESVTAKIGGRVPVILASPQVRPWIRRLTESALPTVAILGYGEIVRGINIRTHGLVILEEARGSSDESRDSSSVSRASNVEPRSSKQEFAKVA